MVEPDRITNDVGWKSVVFISIHQRSIDERQLTCQYPPGEISFASERLLSPEAVIQNFSPIKKRGILESCMPLKRCDTKSVNCPPGGLAHV